MTKIIKVIIQNNRFNVEKEIKALTKSRLAVGSVTAFVGMVRDISDKKDLKYLELEHYPEMTEKALRGICNEAAERWPVEGIIVIHRVGRLLPGEDIVMVLVSSQHRKEAYLANEFVMDFLKSKAPIWKKEVTETGATWVKSATDDLKALNRWI